MNTKLVGQRFGKWTVTDRAIGERSGHAQWWHCKCDCGNTSVVSSANLRAGKSQSCGCSALTQGGLSTTPEYSVWAKMLLRCYSTTNDNYRFYGGLGIYVCQRWRDSFAAFLEDMGCRPSPKHTLDREDTKGSYTCGKCDECQEKAQPANCRWVTKEVQVRNQKNNRYYTHDGKTLILKDWARLTGIKYLTLWNRLNIGMPFAEAISAARYDRKRIAKAKQQ